MKKIIYLLSILFFISCSNLIKTGTLADRKISVSYFQNIKFKTAKGETVKVKLMPDTSRKSQYRVPLIPRSGKYIFTVGMNLSEKIELENVGEKVRESSITGNKKSVPIMKRHSKGFVANYFIKILEKKKEKIKDIYKIKLNILNAAGDFETIHDYILTEEDKIELSKTEGIKKESEVFIPTNHLKKGDRRFLYVYQIVLEDLKGNIIESLNGYSLLWYHDPSYNYIQGYM